MAKRKVRSRGGVPPPPSARLTPEQFRALMKARGYTGAALSQLWGLSPGRISQLAASAKRPAHFDYALWGLPPRDQARAVAQRRHEALANVLRAKQAKASSGSFDKADYWQAATAIGAQFTSDYDFSESIPFGCVGTVISRSGNSKDPLIRLRFTTGHEEDFALSYLQAKDCHLWPKLFVAQP